LIAIGNDLLIDDVHHAVFVQVTLQCAHRHDGIQHLPYRNGFTQGIAELTIEVIENGNDAVAGGGP
jgi:hypothetical protein